MFFRFSHHHILWCYVKKAFQTILFSTVLISSFKPCTVFQVYVAGLVVIHIRTIFYIPEGDTIKNIQCLHSDTGKAITRWSCKEKKATFESVRNLSYFFPTNNFCNSVQLWEDLITLHNYNRQIEPVQIFPSLLPRWCWVVQWLEVMGGTGLFH